MSLPDGLYDILVTERISRSLSASATQYDMRSLKGNASDYLVDAIARQISTILEDIAEVDQDKTQRQLELANALLVTLRRLNADEARLYPIAPGKCVFADSFLVL